MASVDWASSVAGVRCRCGSLSTLGRHRGDGHLVLKRLSIVRPNAKSAHHDNLGRSPVSRQWMMFVLGDGEGPCDGMVTRRHWMLYAGGIGA